jgi:hypothetical protein
MSQPCREPTISFASCATAEGRDVIAPPPTTNTSSKVSRDTRGANAMKTLTKTTGPVIERSPSRHPFVACSVYASRRGPVASCE